MSSTSNPSKMLKCTDLDQYHVTSITSHCGFIVTASRKNNNDIKLWTEKFELVCTQHMQHDPSIVVSWGDLLVVGTFDTIEYWKLKESKENSEYTLDVERVIREDGIEEAVIWNDMLLTRHKRELVQNYFYLWNKQGKKVKNYSKEIRGFNFNVASNVLYVLGGSGIHKFQIDPQDHSKLVKESFDLEDENFSAMCLWGNDLLACVAGYLLYIVTLTGEIIAKFDLWVSAIAIASWGDKLAVVIANYDFPPSLIVLNWDGSTFDAVPLEGRFLSGTLFGYNKSLWLASPLHMMAFTLRRDWNTERLLWIGNLKNNPEECHLALLPKEIIVHIASFLLE